MLGKGEHHQPQEEAEDTGGVVKLLSAEGFEFVVDKKAAMVSNTLRNMLTSPGGFSETRQGEVRFPEIPTHIVEKICQYFYWSLHYSSGKETAEFRDNPGADDGRKLPGHLTTLCCECLVKERGSGHY